MSTWTYSPYLNGRQRPLPKSLVSLDEDDLQCMAEACAEDDHTNHDGWERGNEFAIFLFKDGALHSTYTVTVDYEPVFHAQPAAAKEGSQ